uniref:Uncharacterized protein n=1 Tax=Pseudo-nitzschia australis TaxID=44445 RepID=A0A7S4EMF5_9STRA
MALHHPINEPGFFFFGIMVWSFQMIFHLLVVLRVAGPMSTNEDMDNPSDGLFGFIPSNVVNLSRVTQFMAVLAYCIFADESLQDIVTAVECWPKFSKVKKEDKVGLIMFSCILRFTQGVLATVVVLLLVVNTADAVEIVLNFTAVNFISGFDGLAFNLARGGKYGPKLEAETKRIEELHVPDCMHQKYNHVRYQLTVLPIALALIISLALIGLRQNSPEFWLTKRLRVQFKDGTSVEPYSGCYDLDPVSKNFHKRRGYKSFNSTQDGARFDYCPDSRRWFLHNKSSEFACKEGKIQQLAYSEKTSTFDISSSFESVWYSSRWVHEPV